jgi:hypothetical protein
MMARTTKGLALLAASALMAFSQSPQPSAPANSQKSESAPPAVPSLGVAPETPAAVVPEQRFEFDEVMSGTVVEHDFVMKNQGSVPLLIQKVNMTAQLLVTQMAREVASGTEGRIHLKLDTANLAGKFKGAILVFLNDPALPQAVLASERTVFRRLNCP